MPVRAARHCHHEQTWSAWLIGSSSSGPYPGEHEHRVDAGQPPCACGPVPAGAPGTPRLRLSLTSGNICVTRHPETTSNLRQPLLQTRVSGPVWFGGGGEFSPKLGYGCRAGFLSGFGGKSTDTLPAPDPTHCHLYCQVLNTATLTSLSHSYWRCCYLSIAAFLSVMLIDCLLQPPLIVYIDHALIKSMYFY